MSKRLRGCRPCGRRQSQQSGRADHREAKLLALAGELRARGGLLVVDEAFMDVGPPEASLAGDIDRGNIVVLRSFGKFFGLAGLRLGFALAAPDLAARLNAILGPWAVSGPAMAVAERALPDAAWIDGTRRRLADGAEKLDRLLAQAGVEVVGGTSLFRLVRTPRASEMFQRLGATGVIVRAFREQPTWLRFGIPSESDWNCLRSRTRDHSVELKPRCSPPQTRIAISVITIVRCRSGAALWSFVNFVTRCLSPRSVVSRMLRRDLTSRNPPSASR